MRIWGQTCHHPSGVFLLRPMAHFYSGVDILAAQKVALRPRSTSLPIRAEISGGEVSDFNGFDALVDDDLPQAQGVSRRPWLR